MTQEEKSLMVQSAKAEENKDDAHRKYKNQWYVKNTEEGRRRGVLYYHQHKNDPGYKERRNEYNREYRNRPGKAERRAELHRAWVQRPEYKNYLRKQLLKKNYKLTVEEFNLILIEQGGVCASCGTSEWMKLGPTVDHDHKTGKVRGILCCRCNAAAGNVRDSSAIARKLAEYLEGWGV
jgi:hypothetical protein